jgi:hypothetical protein
MGAVPIYRNLSSSTTRTLRILKEAFVRIWGQEFWARLDYCFWSDFTFSQSSLFIIFKERKEEMATDTNMPNMKRWRDLHFSNEESI